MSDYTQVNDYSAKDALPTGNPSKLVKGSDFDAEFSAIATAITSKYDDTDLADVATAQAATDNTVLITPARLGSWAQNAAGMVEDLQGLADPAADRVLFWDNSASGLALLTISTGLTLSGTTLTVNEADFTRTLTAGVGLSGGGDLSADRTFTLDLNELGVETTIDAGDFLAMVDITDSGSQKITFANLEAALNHDSLTGFVANEHINHGSVSITAGTGLSGGGTIAATRTINLEQATTSAIGGVELATDAEALAGSDTTRAVTSAGLASNQSKAASGYTELPGGIILQWGTSGSIASNTSASVTFPIAFPTACQNVQLTLIDAGVGDTWDPSYSGVSTTGFTLYNHGTGGSSIYDWFAIGY